MRNCLNKPIVALGIAAMTSCMSFDTTTIPSSVDKYYQQIKAYEQKDIYSNIKLEESTNINDSKFGIYDDQNQRYIFKNSFEIKVGEIKDVFGEMTYLSKEGQQEYNAVLDNLFESTGIKLF